MAFSQKSKLKDILADEGASKILEKFIPGMTTSDDPQMKLAMNMTLKSICAFPQIPINKEQLAEMNTELEALPD